MQNFRALDQTARVLILEGVAGIEPHTWARSARPLRRVALETDNMHPDWTTQRNTGVYTYLVKTAEQVLTRYRAGATTSGEDVVQRAMAGLNGSLEPVPTHHFNQIGVIAAEDILAGKTTPHRISAGALSTWIKRMAISITRAGKGKTCSIQAIEENRPFQIPDSVPSNADAIVATLTGQNTELRDLFRKSILEHITAPQSQEIMLAWIDTLANGEFFVPNLAWAVEKSVVPDKGVTSRVRLTRAWEKAQPVLRRALVNNPEAGAHMDTHLTFIEALRA